MKMREILNLLERATTLIPLMIVVHPGSGCGSADFNLGRQDAQIARNTLASFISSWEGRTLIVDGELSDELPRYPVLGAAVLAAFDAGKEAGFGARIRADDNTGDHWSRIVAKKIASLGFDKETPIVVTGVWYFRDNSAGCVNAVYSAVRALGFVNVTISDSAISDPDGDGDEDQEYEHQYAAEGIVTEISVIPPFDDDVNSTRRDTSWPEEIEQSHRVAQLGDCDLILNDKDRSREIYFFLDAWGNPVGRARVTKLKPGFVRVKHIWLDPKIRGQNYGFQFYSYLLETGVAIVSDSDHTPASKKLWQRLADTFVVRPQQGGKPISNIDEFYHAYNAGKLLVAKAS